MKRLFLFPALALLAGCETTPAPAPPRPEPRTQAEWCQQSADLLGNPYLSEWKKAALFEMMRNRGCMR